MNKIRFAVIGLGHMGAAYARMIEEGSVPGGILAAVCDRSISRLSAFPAAKPFTDHRELLRSGAADAVLIATPHASHVPLGIDALNAGLHVIVDKPIAPTLQGARQLLATPVQPGQIFALMLNQRTDPRYQWVRRTIAAGELGRITRMNWIITDWFRGEAYYTREAWRSTWEGGGILLNQAPHQLDLWQWFFGMPTSIRAFCGLGRFHRIVAEDDVTAFFEYPHGATGVFVTTTGEAPGTNRLEIAGDLGKVVVEGSALTFTRNKVGAAAHAAATADPLAKPPSEEIRMTFEEAGGQHASILRNVIAAIRGEEELIAPAAEGIRSVELANTILYSGLTNCTVELPLDGTAFDEEMARRAALLPARHPD